MKKILVLTLVMLFTFAMAGMASAADVTYSGDLKVEYTFDTSENDTYGNTPSATVSVPATFSLAAAEEGVWSVEADLKIDTNLGEVILGDWKANLSDELFTVDLWGGDIEMDSVVTPLEFIDSGGDVNGAARARLTSSAVGFDLTVDYEPDTLYVFGEKAMGDVTIGGAFKKELYVGYATFVTGPATLTGEVGVDSTTSDTKNTMIGGKVSYDLTDEMTLRGKITRKDLNAGDEFVIEGGADYKTALLEASGTLKRTDDVNDATTGAAYNELSGSVTLRANEDVDFGDLFGDDTYYTLTGYAVKAELTYTMPTENDSDTDASATTKFVLTGAAPVVPDMAWVLATLEYKADDDGTADADTQFINGEDSLTEDITLQAKSYTKFTGDAYVKVTDKLTLKPSIKYWTWDTVTDKGETDNADETSLTNAGGYSAIERTELDLTAGLAYALSGSSEVGASYTWRSQKSDNQEVKDGFAKVYFKVSF